jgi:4'-phosphopantetheinyl transferase
MAIFLQQQTSEYKWAVWKMDESEEQLLTLLPHHETYLEQMKTFTAPHRRQEWLSIRVLLYQMLGEEKEIIYNERRKPFISDHSFYISITHTKTYAALILSSTHEVSIDIEQYGRKVERVVSHFVRPDEQQSPYKGDNIWSLLLHWSAKEAVYKYMDILEVDFMNDLRVLPFTVQQQGCFQFQEYKTDEQRLFNIHYFLHPDFVFTAIY